MEDGAVHIEPLYTRYFQREMPPDLGYALDCIREFIIETATMYHVKDGLPVSRWGGAEEIMVAVLYYRAPLFVIDVVDCVLSYV